MRTYHLLSRFSLYYFTLILIFGCGSDNDNLMDNASSKLVKYEDILIDSINLSSLYDVFEFIQDLSEEEQNKDFPDGTMNRNIHALI